MEAVMDAVQANRKLMELNANPARLDSRCSFGSGQKKRDTNRMGTDAHSIDGMDVMRYGVLQARRGGLTGADVANTMEWLNMQSAWMQ